MNMMLISRKMINNISNRMKKLEINRRKMEIKIMKKLWNKFKMIYKMIYKQIQKNKLIWSKINMMLKK